MTTQFETLFGPEGPLFATYLEGLGIDVHSVVDQAVQGLRGAGKFPDAQNLKAYRRKVLFGLFLTEWVRKNKRAKAVPEGDRMLFEFALLQLVTPRMFGRRIREFVARHVDTGTMQLRDGEAFQSHVQQDLEGLMDAMRKSFDPVREGASRGAVPYLENTAISRFLKYRLQARKTFVDRGILSYIEARDTNLSERMSLAYKLSYIPMALHPDEVATLREEYGLSGSLLMPWGISEVASLLGFPHGPALSRRLYNVRSWAKSYSRPLPLPP